MRIGDNLYNYIVESANAYHNAYHQKKQKFINSIKSPRDLSDDKISDILSYFGHEGFNDYDDALEYLQDKIEFLRAMPDPIILYRIVGVKNKKLIDKSNLGQHFTPFKWALDGDMLLSIGVENWDDDVNPYVVEAIVPHSEIDVVQTLIQNLSFPSEHEINIKNNARGVKVVGATKMEGY